MSSSQCPDKTFGFLLHDVARLLRRRFEEKARELKLTRSQWQVLTQLTRNEGIHQGALADLLEIKAITLVRLLDRMEKAGLVQRRSDPTDRRVRKLYLTAKAHPLLAEMKLMGTAAREEALKGISKSDRDTMLETLITMKTNLLNNHQGPKGRPRRRGMARQETTRPETIRQETTRPDRGSLERQKKYG